MRTAREATLPVPCARPHFALDSVRRLYQARLRQRGEQYTAETGRSTPTVQLTPHCGQFATMPFFTASVLARVRRIRRQCRERQTDEQNTADGINGSPHPRHNRGPTSMSTDATSRSRGAFSPAIPAPYARQQPAPTRR
ncbi:hypothetical protein ACFVYR_20295 [Streptomyces sp. NPDC058284]|uniref:hypothetical protein n=1 Tax=unclassified Streptomyces TaxID=2593676 RepID=UPI00365E7C54